MIANRSIYIQPREPLKNTCFELPLSNRKGQFEENNETGTEAQTCLGQALAARHLPCVM